VEKHNDVGEMTMNGAVFLCSATYLGPREEIVLVFHDITEIRKLEKIKSDFVLNVSHELRTPLTSIKGFVETMEAEGRFRRNRSIISGSSNGTRHGSSTS
jgi:two-component system phosphate regulon sensor histidine kinase PhoR